MRKIFFLCVVMGGMAACGVDDSSTAGEKSGTSKRTTEPVAAIVMDEGDPAADGCGWTLMIDSVRYKPTSLDDQFKITDLRVNVTYEELETIYRCGLAASPMTEIKILSIETD